MTAQDRTETTEINQVGVVGAGTMGIGICEVAAKHGHDVLLFDVNQTAAEQALLDLGKRLSKRVVRGKITQQQANAITDNIQVVDQLDEFKACDLVVEAVIEDLSIKQQIFRQLELVTSDLALLASNTSSISITAIAAGMSQPERLFGLHFFNPAPVMKLVEVISGLLTDEVHLQQAVEICKSWQKIPVRAASTPGFIVNRVARSFYGEPLKMLQEQMASFQHIDAVMREAAGFRMGPFELMDLIGVDINYAVSKTVYAAMFNDPRFKPSLLQSEMVNANTLGKKSQQGFYDYRADAPKSQLQPQPQYAISQASLEPITVPEQETDFSAMFGDFEYDKRLWQGDQVLIGGCLILPCAGRLARQIESELSQPICLLDFSFDYQKAEAVNLCFSPQVNDFMQQRIIAVFNHMGKKVLISDDQPGLIALRTVVMLVNEAADAVFNGVCVAKDVDLAMRHGVNYPKGLLALAEKLGWSVVADVLENLQHWFGDDRYRLSPYIRNQQIKNQHTEKQL